MRWWIPTLLIACGPGLLVACGSDDPEAEGRPDFDWAGGEFDFYTLSIVDQCLGGALEALFMPEGPEQPHEFEYPIYVPGYDEVPMSYDIDLRAPFLGMPVTVDEGAGGMLEVRGSVMDAVDLGYAAYGDCVVTMTVDADLLPADSNTVDGQATIAISDARGADQRCPVFQADPCDATLILEAQRN